jgi:hypothetical protein
MCQYMVLVGIYNIIEELSYFFYFLQNKNSKYFPVKNKISLIIPYLLIDRPTWLRLASFFYSSNLIATSA